jgi:hypothetical protein
MGFELRDDQRRGGRSASRFGFGEIMRCLTQCGKRKTPDRLRNPIGRFLIFQSTNLPIYIGLITASRNSLHFTSVAPDGWRSNTLEAAFDALRLQLCPGD